MASSTGITGTLASIQDGDANTTVGLHTGKGGAAAAGGEEEAAHFSALDTLYEARVEAANQYNGAGCRHAMSTQGTPASILKQCATMKGKLESIDAAIQAYIKSQDSGASGGTKNVTDGVPSSGTAGGSSGDDKGTSAEMYVLVVLVVVILVVVAGFAGYRVYTAKHSQAHEFGTSPRNAYDTSFNSAFDDDTYDNVAPLPNNQNRDGAGAEDTYLQPVQPSIGNPNYDPSTEATYEVMMAEQRGLSGGLYGKKNSHTLEESSDSNYGKKAGATEGGVDTDYDYADGRGERHIWDWFGVFCVRFFPTSALATPPSVPAVAITSLLLWSVQSTSTNHTHTHVHTHWSCSWPLPVI